MTDDSSRGGPVNSDVSYFRDTGSVLRFPVKRRDVCHRCGSEEVWQPMQTMNMPIVHSCLRCGLTAPSADFNRSDGDGGGTDE